MSTILEPRYATHTGEQVTLAQLRGRTKKQVWFRGSYLEWCVKKGFIESATPVTVGPHTVSQPERTRLPNDVRRNLAIADAVFADEL